ncbi:MAG: ABC transporter substrate-binding protein [Pseudomonadota bacterium]
MGSQHRPFLFAVFSFVVCIGAARAEAPQRVVSVGGEVTEIVYALGQADRVVATDTTSLFPAAARNTPKVGYMRNLAAEGILSLRPDLVILTGSAGPKPTLDQLREARIPMISFEEVFAIEAIQTKVRTIAEVLEVPEAGEDILKTVDAEWAEAQSTIASFEDTPRLLFFFSLGDGSPKAAGRDTSADAVIQLIGGENVFAEETGFKAFSFEAAVAADPDYILVMGHNAQRLGGIDKVASLPALAPTRAAREGQIVAVDAGAVMTFGLRTPTGLLELARQVHQPASQ